MFIGTMSDMGVMNVRCEFYSFWKTFILKENIACLL